MLFQSTLLIKREKEKYCRTRIQEKKKRLIKSSTSTATDKLCGLPRRIAGSQILFLFFTLAKAQSRKEIVVNLVRLPEAFAPSLLCYLSRRIAGACPAELRGAKYFFYSRKDLPVRRGGWAQKNCGRHVNNPHSLVRGLGGFLCKSCANEKNTSKNTYPLKRKKSLELLLRTFF